MALDKLLENEAQQEIERIRAEAQGRAEQIVTEAQERAQSLIESRTRQLETARQAELVRARSAADLDSNAQRLSAADSLQAQAFQVSEQYLHASVTSPEYPMIVANLLQEALQVLPNAEAVEAAAAEHDAVRQALGQLGRHLDVRVNEQVRTGIRLVGPGGKSSIQNTLVGRLERVRGDLAPQISRLLAE
ncbi:V-type ATP synthase subunit E [Deinococcus taeanensis]|uniref:V-type ATP synthase subunit E n=1 Tax=Deinococcus taeanensis TaxID=2737050 RepID=UPI001CDBCB1E|nr:V-type ATP synthase subunit E [Deinococcus taeanensis]UBV42450.1 V-type ATP synthase subunit E [Deinococcus taeanensis]